MTLFVRLLGQPTLFLDSKPIKFNAPPRTLPLLAYLLLRRAQLLERQQVAFAIWPDESESDARANLRRHIHQLQRVLPPAAPGCPWLVGDSRTIGWNPQSDFQLDVDEFERECGSENHLEEAAACYTGDLLETIYDDWVFFERERLLNQYFDVLTRLVFRCRAQRDYPKAISFARQLLGRDAFREDALRQLITLRYESGDRAGAIQEYENFERLLRNEMGVSPMPETQALHELALRNGRLPDADGSQSSPCECDPNDESDLPLLLPFVGRESEMERVSAWWSRAARGHGGLALIGGEAGVGKSRLARQISLLVESQGGRVLIGRTSPEEPLSYQSIIEALQSVLPLLAAEDGEAGRLAALSVLAPEIKIRRALPDLPLLDAERERIRLFDAVAGSLEQLARPRPLLLILEDLHWAGEATIALLEFLARRAVRAPILILGIYRDEETPRSHPLRRLRRLPQAELSLEHMALSRLSAEAVDCLLSSLPLESLPISLPGRELSARLYAESDGNPLFIGMLLQSWREQGQIDVDTLPAGIFAAISRQLDRLPPRVRAFAEAAAVLGPAFSIEVARELGGWDEAQAYDALQALLDGRLVWESEGRNRFDYFFSHHLIQAALYNEIPAAKRQRRHLRAAETLEDIYPQRLEELAGELAAHYEQGGAPARAIPHYLESARQRRAVFADHEALAALNRALQLTEDFPSSAAPRMVFELLLLREDIHQRRSEREEQRAVLPRLEQLAASLGDPDLVCEVLKRQILFYKGVDDRASHKAHIDLLQQQACALGSRHWKTEAVFAEGNYRKIGEEFPEAIACLEEALTLYAEAGNADGQMRCCCLLAEIFVIERQSAEAEAWAQKALALRAQDTPLYPLMYTLWTLSANGLIAKDMERCQRYAAQLAEVAERAHDFFWQASAERLMGMSLQRQFRIPEARQRLNAALDLYQLIEKPKGRALTLQSLGHVDVSLGNYPAAIRNYEQAYQIGERLGDLNGMASDSINLSFAAALQENYADEMRYAQRAIPLARQIKNRFLEGMALQNLGEAERELGDLVTARQHLEESLSLLDDAQLVSERTSVLADLALAHWKAGDLPLALQTAGQVLESYPEVEGRDDNVHRFLWVAARILRADGQLERADSILAQAYRAFQKDFAAIPEAESRQAFADIRHNRQIAAAYEHGKWP
jgi:DNA-binding SARP family transcriptional activator/predicted ATPase